MSEDVSAVEVLLTKNPDEFRRRLQDCAPGHVFGPGLDIINKTMHVNRKTGTRNRRLQPLASIGLSGIGEEESRLLLLAPWRRPSESLPVNFHDGNTTMTGLEPLAISENSACVASNSSNFCGRHRQY